ncbi:uncharacterized protein (DUF736 family) [Sphingomonas sp. BE138]|uniref:DUF736 domain-containing protein n=1 Tax=Sphingomonas sp. BE138 TaxID=2817845 RepID=UPI00285A990F|nr:DUF736 domain-containing protein [Sphingomonas sp. BE138]MDR6789137.1 uncharacterized protein (DUF736 family) [Sphingomonas sp. BE138]
MNIGSFKSVNGQLLGSVATATIDLARLGLRPVESTNERAPAFEIMVLNVAKRWVQIGALWEMTSNSSGESFYQGKLDDPSLPEPLQIMLFGDAEEGYRVVWNRPTARRENLDGSRTGRRTRANTGDDFAGNATADGQIADANVNDPDYVPQM